MIYPWQKTQWQQLSEAFLQHRLSHAYLLSGIAGLGKTDFARAFSALILCERPSAHACGVCKGCQLMAAGTHPDFIPIMPHEKGHAIKIDQIRLLTQQVTQKSQRGGYQVVVISPADAMPVGAANALLKTLEEPQGNVVLLLVTNYINQLPATIISRCQQLHFCVIDQHAATDWLKTQVKTEHDLSVLLTLAGGAPLLVSTLIENDFFALRNDVVSHLEAILKKQASPIAPIVNWLKADNQLLFYILMTIAMDLSRIQFGVRDGLIHADALPPLQKIASMIPVMRLQQWMQKLFDKKRLIVAGVNLNAQLMFEDLMIDISKSGSF